MKLYHWTCRDHGAPEIMATGLVVPRAHPLLGVKLSWWSHVSWASRAELGLSSQLLTCDRMSVQFVADVDTHQVASWSEVRLQLMRAKPETIQNIHSLEAARGAKPGFWWVAPEPIAVALVLEGSPA